MKKKELKLMLEFCWDDERGPIGDHYLPIENISKAKLMEVLGVEGDPNVTPLGVSASR